MVEKDTQMTENITVSTSKEQQYTILTPNLTSNKKGVTTLVFAF